MRSSTFASTALLSAAVAMADSTTNQWATYPSVAKTATINGFADRIYDSAPECAKSCLKSQGTSNTPCPYWDTGCLCVMPQYNGPVANCVIEACGGSDVSAVAAQATAACSAAGVWEPYWMLPSSVSAALSSAMANTAAAESATTTAEETSSTPTAEASTEKTSEAAETTAETSEPVATSEAPKTTEAESSEAKSTAAETTSASSSAAASSVTVQTENGANKQALIGSVGAVAALALLF